MSSWRCLCLVLALLLVNSLRSIGVIGLLEQVLEPVFLWLELPTAMLLPIITKYIAGGTAMMGVAVDFLDQQLISVSDLNRVSGFLVSPLDVGFVVQLIFDSLLIQLHRRDSVLANARSRRWTSPYAPHNRRSDRG